MHRLVGLVYINNIANVLCNSKHIHCYKLQIRNIHDDVFLKHNLLAAMIIITLKWVFPLRS